MTNWIADIERQDRERDSRRYECPADRQQRIFWEETERVLQRFREPEERTPALYDIEPLLRDEQERELAAIDEAWGWRR